MSASQQFISEMIDLLGTIVASLFGTLLSSVVSPVIAAILSAVGVTT